MPTMLILCALKAAVASYIDGSEAVQNVFAPSDVYCLILIQPFTTGFRASVANLY